MANSGFDITAAALEEFKAECDKRKQAEANARRADEEAKAKARQADEEAKAKARQADEEAKAKARQAKEEAAAKEWQAKAEIEARNRKICYAVELDYLDTKAGNLADPSKSVLTPHSRSSTRSLPPPQSPYSRGSFSSTSSDSPTPWVPAPSPHPRNPNAFNFSGLGVAVPAGSVSGVRGVPVASPGHAAASKDVTAASLGQAYASPRISLVSPPGLPTPRPGVRRNSGAS